MSSRPQLPASAEYVDEQSNVEVRRLNDHVRRLTIENDNLRAQLDTAREQIRHAHAPVRAIQRILDPLHKALAALYGEIDAAGIGDIGMPAGEGAPAGQPISETKYAAWKQRLPPSCGKIIDALLIQPMNGTQLKTACRLGSTSITTGLSILLKNNLIEKDGSLNRLKRI